MLYGIANNDLSVARHLIDAGADVNIKDQVRVTSPLCRCGQMPPLKSCLFVIESSEAVLLGTTDYCSVLR